MAIVLHSQVYEDIKIDSNMIIGVTGNDYHTFLKSLEGDNVYYVNRICYSKKTISEIIGKPLNQEKLSEYLDQIHLNRDFLSKRVSNLSHSEIKLLGYLLMLINDSKIIVINEPFQDLDYDYKKGLISLFNHLVKNKTIIIGSIDSDLIYLLCKKVLLLNKKKYIYDDVNILSNKNILKAYHIEMPQILEFIRLAKDKKVNLSYSKDTRDLIKDVYKHVSK